jgi:hypothetical protein
MPSFLKLEPGETSVDDIGIFTCNLVHGIRPQFRVRGVALDRQQSALSPQPAQPVASLALSMYPEEALQLAVAILGVATEANIELPKEVSFQSARA